MDRRRRSDAVDNRARIVAAARSSLDAREELKLNAVAKAAGIGQGTLYRHFPTREALLAEVYRSDVDELVESADHLLLEHDPISALSRWFDRVAEYARVKRGVLASLDPHAGTALATGSTPSIREAIVRLLEAGRAEGVVRDDVDADDVLLMLGFLSRMTEQEAQERAARLLGVLVDGLRVRGVDRTRREVKNS